MSTGKTYLRCACPHCRAEVQYPDYAAGGTSVCTSCKTSFRLPGPLVAPAKPAAPAAPATRPPAPSTPAVPPTPRVTTAAPPADKLPASQPAASGSSRGLQRFWLWSLNLAVLVAVAVVLVNNSREKNATPPTEPLPEAQPGGTAPPSAVPAANSLVAPTSSAPAAASPPATDSAKAAMIPLTPKSISELKVSTISIDQPKGTKGSRLVYVVGALKNESDHQRFGVRVELDLLDAAGTKVGSATDYRATLEPRQTWQFRALINDRRAIGARVAAIREDQ